MSGSVRVRASKWGPFTTLMWSNSNPAKLEVRFKWLCIEPKDFTKLVVFWNHCYRMHGLSKVFFTFEVCDHTRGFAKIGFSDIPWMQTLWNFTTKCFKMKMMPSGIVTVQNITIQICLLQNIHMNIIWFWSDWYLIRPIIWLIKQRNREFADFVTR